MNTKTRVIKYRFNTENPKDQELYSDLCNLLRSKGYSLLDALGNTKSRFFETLPDWVELEYQYLFTDQWNSTNLRLMEWATPIYPNKDLKEGYFLYIPEDLIRYRKKYNKCNYCGSLFPVGSVCSKDSECSMYRETYLGKTIIENAWKPGELKKVLTKYKSYIITQEN